MKTIKKIWFLALLLLLFLPMLQWWLHFADEKPLDGAFVETPKPVVTLKTLYEETAQDSLTTWFTEQCGFRRTMIRLNNQLLYSAFGKISAIGPVKSKNGKTFIEESYIISYTGETFIGEERIQQTSRQLKLIQDMLRTKGVTLLPVFTVGKASYYPELIPDKYLSRSRGTNNYQVYLKALQEVQEYMTPATATMRLPASTVPRKTHVLRVTSSATGVRKSLCALPTTDISAFTLP